MVSSVGDGILETKKFQGCQKEVRISALHLEPNLYAANVSQRQHLPWYQCSMIRPLKAIVMKYVYVWVA